MNGLHVRWTQDHGGSSAHDQLLDLVGLATGLDRAELRVGHACGRCGGSDHGRPLIVADAALPTDLAVSVSRAGSFSLVAVCETGPVGVDVECIDAVGAMDFDLVALHPDEDVGSAAERAIVWTRKESLLKAAGHGLIVDPRQIKVSPVDQPAALLNWESQLPLGCDVDAVEMLDLALPPGLAGCVTRLPAGEVVLPRRARSGTDRQEASRRPARPTR